MKIATHYEAVYKCMLCGELLSAGEPAEIPKEQLKELLEMVIQGQYLAINPHSNIPPMQISHQCSDGNTGLAQFVGFRQVTRWKS